MFTLTHNMLATLSNRCYTHTYMHVCTYTYTHTHSPCDKEISSVMRVSLQSTSIDGPSSDLALKDGVLLDSTDLANGLPTLSIDVGVDVDTLDW